MKHLRDGPSKWIKTGKDCRLDDTSILGEISGRKGLPPRPLIVGHHARVRSGAVLYTNTIIGHHFQTGHGTVVREENRVGNHVCVWNYTTIDYGCRIGHRVKIHSNVYVAQYSTIEDDVFIGPGVTFANDLFPKARHAEKVLQGPVIKRGAAIGAHCTLLPGVVIGERALIGAGSVVTHDIPAGAVAWGNPAVVRKTLGDLRWPDRFSIQRAKARTFYRRLAGRRAFPTAK
jgi:acetyltransferase-like isoleucine patch superfamily enzyme